MMRRTIWAAPMLALLLLPTATGSAPKQPRAEIDKLLGEKARTDYNASYAALMAPYTLASGDRRDAFLVENSIPIADTRPMQAYLTRVAGVLLAGWGGPKPNVRIHVTAQKEWDAKAYKEGVITISAGLIERFDSVDPLAAILAHELGHVLAEHGSERSRLVAALTGVAGVASSGGILVEVGRTGKMQGGQLKVQPTGSMQELAIAGYSAQAIAADVLEPGLKRGQEYEADRIALDLLARSPFAVPALDRAIEELVRAETASSQHLEKSRELVTYLAATQIAKETQGEGDLGKTVGTLFLVGADQALKVVTGGIAKALAGGEADPDKRRDRIGKYTTEVIGAAAERGPPPTHAALAAEFRALRTSPAWRSAVATIHAVSESRQATQDLAMSIADAQQQKTAKGSRIVVQGAAPAPIPLGRLPDDPAVPQAAEYRGFVAQFHRRLPDAIREYEQASRNPYASLNGQTYLGTIYATQGNVPALDRTIERTARRAGRQTRVLPLMVARERLAGNMAKAEQLSARCLSEGGRDLYFQCALMIGYDAACAPRTPEGEVAFIAPKTGSGLKDLINIPGVFNRQDQKQTCI